jgi:hypothetical protein
MWVKIPLRLGAMCSCAVLVICCARIEPVLGNWLQHEKWDQGLAEVCLYEGKQLKYGAMRDTMVSIITVREHFDPEKLVKTRPSKEKEVLNVMKQNFTRETRTGVYKYNQMASAFVLRDSAELVKMSAVSQEWCGNSFVLWEKRGEQSELFLSNYMDDKGRERKKVSPKVILREELILYLRQHLASIEQGQSWEMAYPLMTNNPVYRKQTIRVAELAERKIEEKKGVAVTLETENGLTETYVFQNTELRPLLSWENSKGEMLILKKRMWLDYWNKNQPSDARLLPAFTK